MREQSRGWIGEEVDGGRECKRAERDYGRGVCYVAAGEQMRKAAKKGEGGKERGKEGARGVDA